MISLAGVTLSIPTREILQWIDRHLPQEDCARFLNRAWPGFGTVGLAWPTGYRPLPRPRVNHFTWPSGASRWAQGLFLAHGADVDQLHDQAFGKNGDQSNTVTLKLYTEDHEGTIDEKLSTSVYLFPPIPVNRLVDSEGTPDNAGYLLACVDARYFWWQTATPDLGITETAGKTWKNVFDSLAGALGVTIGGSDDIDDVYLQPSRALNLTWEVIPPVLDAAAWNVGRKLSCTYDGSYILQDFQTAKDAYDQDGEDHDKRVVVAGGPLFADEF